MTIIECDVLDERSPVAVFTVSGHYLSFGCRDRRRSRRRHEVDHELYARKQTELRDRLANLKLQLDVIDRTMKGMI